MKKIKEAKTPGNAFAKTNQQTNFIPRFKEGQGKLDFNLKEELEILKDFPLKIQKEILKNKLAEVGEKLEKFKGIISSKVLQIKDKENEVAYRAAFNLLYSQGLEPLLRRKRRLELLWQAIQKNRTKKAIRTVDKSVE